MPLQRHLAASQRHEAARARLYNVSITQPTLVTPATHDPIYGSITSMKIADPSPRTEMLLISPSPE